MVIINIKWISTHVNAEIYELPEGEYRPGNRRILQVEQEDFADPVRLGGVFVTLCRWCLNSWIFT